MPSGRNAVIKTGANNERYVDWKQIDELRRMMSPNGKIYGRKRLGTTAVEQRLIAQAIKRARFMGLLPYTSATL
ncbi:MAG: 30S ribosomal protein S18 [Planctomycetota bacterium]